MEETSTEQTCDPICREGKDTKLTELGITLITLVVTIIVLLILAGITIMFTIGENGIINKAQQAGQNYKVAETEEQEGLQNLENEIQNHIVATSRGETDSEPGIEGVTQNSVLMNSVNENLQVETVSLNSFTNTFSSNLFEQYFSYEETTGELTCQKDGWYLINMRLDIASSYASSWSIIDLIMKVNEIEFSRLEVAISVQTAEGSDSDSVSVYLKKGDKITFEKSTMNIAPKGRNKASIRFIKL